MISSVLIISIPILTIQLHGTVLCIVMYLLMEVEHSEPVKSMYRYHHHHYCGAKLTLLIIDVFQRNMTSTWMIVRVFKTTPLLRVSIAVVFVRLSLVPHTTASGTLTPEWHLRTAPGVLLSVAAGNTPSIWPSSSWAFASSICSIPLVGYQLLWWYRMQWAQHLRQEVTYPNNNILYTFTYYN